MKEVISVCNEDCFVERHSLLTVYICCCCPDVSSQSKAPQGKELRCLWRTAKAVTLWQAQSHHSFLGYIRICLMTSFYYQPETPNKHLLGACTPYVFLCEITSSVHPKKTSFRGLVPVQTPPGPSLPPLWTLLPWSLSPLECFDLGQLQWGPLKALSPGSLTGKEGFYWPCGMQPAFKPPTSSSAALLHLNSLQLSIITRPFHKRS